MTPYNQRQNVLVLFFAAYCVAGVRLNGSHLILTVIAEKLVPVFIVLFVGYAHGWDIVVFAILLPAVIGATMLGFLFDYVAYAPHEDERRFGATRMFLFPKWLSSIGSGQWLAQNYHLVHHLYP